MRMDDSAACTGRLLAFHLPAYRDDNKSALDTHRSHIADVSLAMAKGSAIYVPLCRQWSEKVRAQSCWSTNSVAYIQL